MIMRMEFKLLPTLVLLLSLTACSSAFLIKSDPPGASVYMDEKLMGQTPLKLAQKDLPYVDNIHLRVEKQDYGTFETIIPGPHLASLGEEIAIQIPKAPDETAIINQKVSLIIQAHRLALDGQTHQAIQILDQLIAENPKLISAHLLKGSILFLGKNLASAREAYEQVLVLDPSNREAIKMLEYIQAARPSP